MSNPLQTDLFVEDQAHEELLRPVLERLAYEQHKVVEVRVRSARGGHGQVIAELRLYQKTILKGIGGDTLPDLLVVAIDANCKSFTAVQNTVRDCLMPEFKDRTVVASPDPHIERWYQADPKAFHQVVGVTPVLGKQKCDRDVYKQTLAQAVAEAGHPPTLGGIEFARELADAMDYYRAGKADSSLKHFLEEIAARFKSL